VLNRSRNVGGGQQNGEEVEAQHDKSDLDEEDLDEEGPRNPQLG